MLIRATTLAVVLTVASPVASITPASFAAVPSGPLPSAFHPTIGVTVETRAGPQHFQVEVARTPEEQEKGLMFRRSLPEGGGMLFPIVPTAVASFWMKNTRMSLDILFIRADGTVMDIRENATPFSTEVIDSGEPVGAVLEIAGGRSAALGIHRGDKVRWQEAVGAL